MKQLYIKKNYPIEAVQYKGELDYVDGFDFYEISGRLIKTMTLEEVKNNPFPRAARKAFIFLKQNGIQGRVAVEIGDYILFDGNNKSVMKKDEFESNYEQLQSYEIKCE